MNAPPIDLRTLFFANAILRIALAAAMILTWRRNPSILGLGRLSRSHIAFLLGLLFFASRGPTPDLVHVLGGSLFVVLGSGWLLEGFLELHGNSPSHWPKTAALAIVGAGSWYFLEIEPSFRMRNFLLTGTVAVLMLAAAGTALAGSRRPEEREPFLLLLGTVGLLGALEAVHSVATLLRTRVDDPFTGDPLAAAVVTMSLVSSAGWTLGVITLVNARLSQQMAEAVAEMRRSERAAHEARDEAVKAGRAKEEFLSSVTHELRTPLNAVIGLTGLLMETPLDEERLENLRTIRSSGDTLLRLINEILDFSKISSGKLELELVPFEVRACVEDCIDLVAGAAAEKGVELALLVDSSVPARVRHDAGRLRQVLTNLLGNSVKFTEQGEVVVSVTSRYFGNDGAELSFSVRDTGPGIPSDRLESIFRPFVQADASTSRRYGGTGLGLAISRQLLELMGGTIRVESELGAGSTFTAMVPAEVVRALDVETPALRGHGILVVDSCESSRTAVARLLQGWGVLVEEATSVEAALSRGVTAEIAILDRKAMERIEAIQELRRAADGIHVVVLAPMGRRTPLASVADVVLTKPARAKQLAKTLLRLLSGEAPPARHAPATLATTSGRLLPAVRILLVEDNSVNQRVASLMLRRLGFAADAVGNGAEAVESATGSTYDVIVMDVQMPEMDGLEATRRIRRLDLPRRPYIVAMTAGASAKEREQCREAGMDDFVGKPVLIDELEKALEKASRHVEVVREESSPMIAKLPCVNRAALTRLEELAGPEIVTEVVGEYRSSLLARLDAMANEVRAGRPQKLAFMAHSFKGTAAALGAERLVRICARLEKDAGAGTLSSAADTLARLTEEAHLVDETLAAQLPAAATRQPPSSAS